MLSGVYEPKIITRLVDSIAPRFVNRPGGYTRIIRLDNRVQDNAPMVLFQFVQGEEKRVIAPVVSAKAEKPSGKTKVVRKTVKKEEVKKEVKKK